MSSINFQRGEIIGKEELIHWNTYLRETLGVLMSTIGWGGQENTLNSRGALIRNYRPLTDELKVSLGTNPVGGYNTIKINAGWGVGSIEDAYVDPIVSSTVDTSVNGIPLSLDNINNVGVLYKELQDNIKIPGISGLGAGVTRYVVVHPRITVFEKGTCNISTSNQVTFTDSTIVAKLRDQSSKSPSKLRFFTNTSTAYNSGHVYEVVSIVDDNNVIISGVFASSASNLYVAIVGSYDLKEQAILSGATQYLYGYVRGEVEFSTTATGSYGGFPVALLTFAADHSFAIADLRPANLFTLGLGGGVGGALMSQNNLSDLDDPATARDILSVYSETEVIGINSLTNYYKKTEIYSKIESDAKYAIPTTVNFKSNVDYDQSSFIGDFAWHNFDISSKINSETKFVYIRLGIVKTSGAQGYFAFRKAGDLLTNGYASDIGSYYYYNSLNTVWNWYLWIPVTSGVFSYKFQSGTFDSLYLTIIDQM